MAAGIAIPDPHPTAWNTLDTIRKYIFVLNTQARLARTYTLIVVRIIGLRPNLSDNGPNKRPEKLMMKKNVESVEFTSSTDVLSCSFIMGVAGRYMSVAIIGKEQSIEINTIMATGFNCREVLMFCFIDESSTILNSEKTDSFTNSSVA
jgi:hypothetical protein